MKQAVRILLCALLCVSLTSCSGNSVKHPYTQEYVAGEGNIQGNVDIEDFYSRDPRFEIGATAEGMAVFKDPNAAFTALQEKYADGIALIQKEQHLQVLSQKNYPEYKTYGWQVTTGSDAEKSRPPLSAYFWIFMKTALNEKQWYNREKKSQM